MRSPAPLSLILLCGALLSEGCVAHQAVRPATPSLDTGGGFSARLAEVTVSSRRGEPVRLHVEVENTGADLLHLSPEQFALVAAGAPDHLATPLRLGGNGEQVEEEATRVACAGAGAGCIASAGASGLVALLVGVPQVGLPLLGGSACAAVGMMSARTGREWSAGPIAVQPGSKRTIEVETTDPRVLDQEEAIDLLVRPRSGDARFVERARLPLGDAAAAHKGFSAPEIPLFVGGVRGTGGAFVPFGDELVEATGTGHFELFAGVQRQRLGVALEAAAGRGWMLGGELRWTAMRGARGALVPWVGYGYFGAGEDPHAEDGFLHGNGVRLGVDLLAFVDAGSAYGWNLGTSGLGLTAYVAPMQLERVAQPLQPSRLNALQLAIGLEAALF